MILLLSGYDKEYVKDLGLCLILQETTKLFSKLVALFSTLISITARKPERESSVYLKCGGIPERQKQTEADCQRKQFGESMT